MKIEYDTDKRDKTLMHRGLDFAQAHEVFKDIIYSEPDTRMVYPEERIITIGYLDERMVVVVWTQRGDVRRIISMRKANEREIIKYTVD